MHTSATKRGITVLELLVIVIACVVVVSVVPSLYNNLLVKAHDIKRLKHQEQLQGALQTYFLYNGSYPVVTTPKKITGKDELSKILQKSFLVLGTRLPIDPGSPAYDYTYQSMNEGKSYTITYCLQAYEDATHMIGCENKTYPKAIEWNPTTN